MFRIYNSLGKKMEAFHPVNEKVVTIFTCGPSVYQRAHIGNFRTFLIEDILERYLQYLGYKTRRGMNLTDLEDKTIIEAEKKQQDIKALTTRNIRQFLKEMKLLRMKIPDFLPRASEHVDNAVDIIQQLLQKGIAYRHEGNVYFDPLQFPGFGKIYGLDMSRWPKKKRRFHKDTYPGIQWNLGDFILWHGNKGGEKVFWETKIGKGRPSWNIEDPSMIRSYVDETLSFYCGGIDNLYRHHDYTLAILEAIRPYPMASFWLHCQHLTMEAGKMSKSKGNVVYTDTLLKKGYSVAEIRFFLIYGHYRKKLDYSEKTMPAAVHKLDGLKKAVRNLRRRAIGHDPAASGPAKDMKKTFEDHMDDDLHVDRAFDAVSAIVAKLIPSELDGREAAGVIKTLKEIDKVLMVVF